MHTNAGGLQESVLTLNESQLSVYSRWWRWNCGGHSELFSYISGVADVCREIRVCLDVQTWPRIKPGLQPLISPEPASAQLRLQIQIDKTISV